MLFAQVANNNISKRATCKLKRIAKSVCFSVHFKTSGLFFFWETIDVRRIGCPEGVKSGKTKNFHFFDKIRPNARSNA